MTRTPLPPVIDPSRSERARILALCWRTQEERWDDDLAVLEAYHSLRVTLRLALS